MTQQEKQLNDLMKFIRVKDQEIRRQVERRRMALNQRNWMILFCIANIITTLILWLR